jgi:sulfane dehydrogenase subunit SoxC
VRNIKFYTGLALFLLTALAAGSALSCAQTETQVTQASLSPTSAAPTLAPTEEPGTWHLRVDGLVEKPLVLSYESVLAFPGVEETTILYCPGVYENQPVREWYGVPVTSLLAEAGLQPAASRLILVATDGYKTVISIERVIATGAILAYAVDGAPLSVADGYPFRLVSAEMEGDMWIGWVYRIEVS